MAMTQEPCAYCGEYQLPRERGHVIQRSIYPSSVPSNVQRPTVPECVMCKKIWQDAETQFRNIVLVAGEPNNSVTELWSGPVIRSFDKPSGPRWLRDLTAQMVPVETAAGPRYAVYPDRDSRVMTVVRRIIRGLCHYHNLGTAIADCRVFAQVMRYEIPPAFWERFVPNNLGDQFCRYWYYDLRAEDPDHHSSWVIEFFGRTKFFGIVSANEVGWPEQLA